MCSKVEVKVIYDYVIGRLGIGVITISKKEVESIKQKSVD